jgi:hypothetical protein
MPIDAANFVVVLKGGTSVGRTVVGYRTSFNVTYKTYLVQSKVTNRKAIDPRCTSLALL